MEKGKVEEQVAVREEEKEEQGTERGKEKEMEREEVEEQVVRRGRKGRWKWEGRGAG